MSSHKVYSRITAKGTIVAISPVHLGGTGGDESTDLALITDGQGRHLIPGTGLTGAIRAALNEHFEDAGEGSAFGFQKGEAGAASLIFVDDAAIISSAKPIIRQGVGINRFTGAAADKIKHDRAVLPAGSEFEFRISAEPKSEEQANELKQLLADLQSLLLDKKIRIGGAKTRALGQIGISRDLVVTEVVLVKECILSFLKGNSTKATLPTPKLHERKSIRIRLDWEPRGPVMVKAEREGIDIDMLPYTEQVGDRIRLVIPGSGIKGAFRSRAELIVRTVQGTDLLPESEFLDQVLVPIVMDLFGEAPTGKGIKTGKQGALFASDCKSKAELQGDIALRLLSGDETADGDYPTTEDKQNARLHNKPVGNGKLYKRTHNSIDRWTGGTADGALYSVCEPWGVEWEPIVFDVDWGRLEQQGQLKNSLWLICALLLQADQGWIPLGFGANRGLGDWKITGLTIEGWPEGFGDPPTFIEGQGIVIPDETKKKLAYTSEEAGQ